MLGKAGYLLGFRLGELEENNAAFTFVDKTLSRHGALP